MAAGLQALVEQIIKDYNEYIKAKAAGEKGEIAIGRVMEFGQSSRFCTLACATAFGGKHKSSPEEHKKYLQCYFRCKMLVGRVSTPITVSLQEFAKWLEQSGAPYADQVVTAIKNALSAAQTA